MPIKEIALAGFVTMSPVDFDTDWPAIMAASHETPVPIEALRYIPDDNEWHFRTTLETAAAGGGDCEDLAIYVCVSLPGPRYVLIGFLPNLRVHATCAQPTSDGWLLHDATGIDLTGFAPAYAFNEDGVWRISSQPEAKSRLPHPAYIGSESPSESHRR